VLRGIIDMLAWNDVSIDYLSGRPLSKEFSERSWFILIHVIIRFMLISFQLQLLLGNWDGRYSKVLLRFLRSRNMCQILFPFGSSIFFWRFTFILIKQLAPEFPFRVWSHRFFIITYDFDNFFSIRIQWLSRLRKL